MSFASSRVWALQQVFRGIKNAKGVFFLALMLASLSLTIPVFTHQGNSCGAGNYGLYVSRPQQSANG